MDIITTFNSINWISVLVAAVSTFLVGGIWYGPIFGTAWMKEFNFSEEDLKKRSVLVTFGVSLLLAFFAALILDMFLGHQATLETGFWAGLLAGVGWIATFLGILYLFEMQSLKAYLINAGYCVVSMMLMGLILGAW